MNLSVEHEANVDHWIHEFNMEYLLEDIESEGLGVEGFHMKATECYGMYWQVIA